MNRLLGIVMAVVMLLGLLSGCQKGMDAPETMETTAATVATEVTTEAATKPQVNDTVFKAGTWMAQCGPTSRYYFFDEGGASGRFVNMEDGRIGRAVYRGA